MLEQIKTILATRMPASAARQAAIFTDVYFHRMRFEDLNQESAVTHATMVVRQIEFLQKRGQGELLIRVFNPSKETDGWESQHTIVELANDDMPFLVDTTNIAIREQGLGVHLLVHPVLNVERDTDGELLAIHSGVTKTSTRESYIQIQIDRQTTPAVLKSVVSSLRSRITMVRTSVADWLPMKKCLEDAITEFSQDASDLSDEVRAECVAFLKWVNNDHFMLIGSRTYDVIEDQTGTSLNVVKGTGLGLLREHGKTVLSRPVSAFSDQAKFNQNSPLIITKTNARSPMHRSGYMDYIGVLRFDREGRVIGEYRFIGLFTSQAYLLRVSDTPLVRMKVDIILQKSGMAEDRHAWKTMLHILESLPRDDVLQASSTELLSIATGVLNLQERAGVRLFIRRERFGRFFSCLVYIPRDYFNTENREKIQKILKRALKGNKLDYVVQVSELALARLHVIVRPRSGAVPQPDVRMLENKIINALRSWNEELTNTLVQKHGEEVGLQWARNIGDAFPKSYMEDVSPWVASFDVEKIALLVAADDLQLSLYRPRTRVTGIIRFKIFKRDRSVPLSDVLPMLEDLGLHIVSERPYELKFEQGRSVWVQDFDMVYGRGTELELEVVRENFQQAFENIWRGITTSDGFNRLILACHLHWRQVKGIRAYCKYLLQTGITYSQAYMEETLARHPLMARLLVELFDAMFNPVRDDESEFRKELESKNLQRALMGFALAKGSQDKVFLEYIDKLVVARQLDRDKQIVAIKKLFMISLTRVKSLDEDRILHAFYEVIKATLRTNFFLEDEQGELLEYMSFKLDSAKVPDLPRPRPFREIWIFSSEVEGIHLRGGTVARGGLRWSDRKEDFRTEVLGLMKAQNVKNTIIVPVGAKGGFVVKNLPANGSRDAVVATITRAYEIYINGLLDITDNLDEEKIIPPAGLIRRDGDDPYLVVAADKGTASFSDTANAIALERGFWLGDAFASGGSVGYDHKGMAITARGAWEGVKRHFRELGKNIQAEPFSVVGIGDMSGDVFGNGMLLSRQIKLRAAFNHLHIFLDPNPDVKSSFKERKRLFKLSRSGWNDYKTELISRGGGGFILDWTRVFPSVAR